MAAVTALPRIATQAASRVRCASPMRRGAKDGSQRGGSAALSILSAVPLAIEAARELHLHRQSLGERSGMMRQGGAAHGAKAVPISRSVKIAAVERYMARRRRTGATSLVAAQGAKAVHAAAVATVRGSRGVGGAGMLPRGAPSALNAQPRLGGAALGVPRSAKLATPAKPMLGGSVLKHAVTRAQPGGRPAGLGGASTGVIPARSAPSAQPQLGGAAMLRNAASAAAGAVHRFGGAVQRAAQATLQQPLSSAPGNMALGGSRLGRRAAAEPTRAAALLGGSGPRRAVAPAQAVHAPRQGGSALSARCA